MPVFTHRVAEQLNEVRERWGDVLTARHPGTPRPWAELAMTAEERERRDALARAERAERLMLTRQGIDPPGYTRSAARDDVLDVIEEVERGMLLLEDAVRDRLGYSRLCERCRHEADAHLDHCAIPGCDCPDYRLTRRPTAEPSVRYLTITGPERAQGEFRPAERHRIEYVPEGSLHWASVWLEDQLPAITTDETLAEHFAAEVARLHRLVVRVLGLVEDGTLIKAPCIGCDGATPEQPEGGALTLRLYADGYVLCHNPLCDPPTDLCGSRLRGKPMWPYEELEWLAARLDDRAATARKRAG
ncbi:hypothetical protein ACGFNU_01935 [Spirillospora sp. NPDC048911]|uniref:hypothetical protein n=1 Tax=Spirillospora sp. NPDC048911 TaxID=3364527 RepID=UPI00371A8DCF